MGEITVILLLALIFLGPSKLPDLAAGLGKLIKEIRKATSDVKNEIALDDTFRKPFEELRDAVTLHPDELKRRDQWAKEREEAAKRAAEEAAREAAAATVDANGRHIPPDGLADHVKLEDAKKPEAPKPEGAKPESKLSAPKLPVPNGPNETIVQTAPPPGATLDDIPTPPPEVPLPAVKPAPPEAPAAAAKPPAAPVAAAKPPAAPEAPAKPATAPEAPARPSLFATPGTPPLGTVARPTTMRGMKPAPAAAAAPNVTLPGTGAPANGESAAANTTQILKEEDLIPAAASGTPPPPPHLPGLRPAGARVPTPPPIPPLEKKKP